MLFNLFIFYKLYYYHANTIVFILILLSAIRGLHVITMKPTQKLTNLIKVIRRRLILFERKET